MRIGIVGVLGQHLAKRGLGFVELADEHQAVGVVDAIHDIVGLRLCRFFEPGQRFFVLADEGMHRADQVVDDGLAVLVLNSFFEGCVRQRQLPAERVLAREMRPRCPVFRLQPGHRAEGAGGNASLIQLDGNQSNEKMRLRPFLVQFEHAAATCRSVFGPTGLQVPEATTQFVTNEISFGGGFHGVSVSSGAAMLHDCVRQFCMRNRG